jgi:ribonuclease BN (tRNA processing enzyme)
VGLSVTVLGCSGTYAAAGNACSGYLVRDDSTAVWVDCGPGTLANIQQHLDAEFEQLDAVVVTHEHPDHWLELPVLRNALRFGPGREGFPVYTTEGVRRLCEGVVTDGAEPTFEWHVVRDGDSFTVGALTFTCSRTDHPVETLALRVDADGRSLGYSADTGPGWSLAALGPGLDLALCESTLLSHQEGGPPHLSARQAGESARDAGVRRLILTHLWPTGTPSLYQREGSEAFGREVEVAAVGGRYDA